MKVYVVVVNYHPANAPQNYKTECQIFLDKKEAKEEEYPICWGCPNCGCDSVISSGVSGGGLTSGTCRHCKLKFEVRSENPMGIVKYGCHPENPPRPEI